MTRIKFHTQDSQTLGAILIAMANWRPGFVHPCIKFNFLSGILGAYKRDDKDSILLRYDAA